MRASADDWREGRRGEGDARDVIACHVDELHRTEAKALGTGRRLECCRAEDLTAPSATTTAGLSLAVSARLGGGEPDRATDLGRSRRGPCALARGARPWWRRRQGRSQTGSRHFEPPSRSCGPGGWEGFRGVAPVRPGARSSVRLVRTRRHPEGERLTGCEAPPGARRWIRIGSRRCRRTRRPRRARRR